MDDIRTCTSCASAIPAQALRCPDCRARQSVTLHRGGSRVVSGVCGMIAAQLGIEALWVRIGTLLAATFSFGLIFWAYLAAWLATPAELGGRAPLARWLDGLFRMFSPGSSSNVPTRIQ